MPWLERMRFTSSGSEAVTAALRLARGHTNRDEVVKFDGCYHGAVDSLLVKAGSGVETLGLPDSPGVPAALANLTHTLPFNDLTAAEELLQRRGAQIACVIVEPVVGNMGVLVPQPGFLAGLKVACQKAGALLIMDEVMTGFRLARGGAQERLGVRGDLTTFGKVIGGGLPVGALGGSHAVMAKLAPEGPIYQAGTLSGNPLAMAAGTATLRELARPGAYPRLETMSERALREPGRGLPAGAHPRPAQRRGEHVDSSSSATVPSPTPPPPATPIGPVTAASLKPFSSEGCTCRPSQFEAAFVSLAHGEVEVDAIVVAARESLRELG